MNNSKKVNGKWSKKDHKKVYSRSDRAITLIALIVTIIVLLILAGVTINLAVNNQGIFNKAKTATNAYKNASEEEQKGIDEADKEIENYMPPIPGSTLLRKNAPKIKVSGLKYADLDGDGTADGIIVADISKDSTDPTTYKGNNPWGNSNGSFSYTKVTSGLREYEDTSYQYTNADGYKVDGTLIKCKNNTGTPRYYVLSLANYDGNDHYWYKEAYGKMSDYSTFTSKDFGNGKENTKKMIDRMKNHSDTSKYSVDYGEATTGTNADVWNIIEDKFNEGWFVPSKAEWSAFASYLNTTKTSAEKNYYVNYGLNNWYWSSSQRDNYNAWYVYFYYGYMSTNYVNYANSLRLCKTF
jgi:type II secretory pathway pseudopilin PulG